MTASEALPAVLDRIDSDLDKSLDRLFALLRIQSISTDPAYAPQCRTAAEHVAGDLRSLGFETTVRPTEGHPVVIGKSGTGQGNGHAPRVLFYGHYDVQPVDPLDLWKTPPFEPTVRDGEIYARGAADDKGQVFMHLKAIEAHLKQTGTLPVNIKLIIEGEEEVGSVNLDNFIRANKALLGADVVVISDSAMFDRGVPSICYSLRGLVYFQIDLRGTKSDLHSGVFGGAVANPNMVLAQILAQMKDRGGHIKIPGFYDDVRVLQEDERKAWATLPFNEKTYRKDFGIPKVFGESDYTK